MLLMKYITREKIYSKLAADLDMSESVFEAMKSKIAVFKPTTSIPGNASEDAWFAIKY